jgi:acyl-CoA synthetase (AMP-forming)/AMP-acid ligase II
MTIADFYELGADDVSLCVKPLFNIHGLVASTLAAFAGGGSVVAPRRIAPRRVWQQLDEHAVTWFSAGPTLHHMLLDRADVVDAARSLRFTRSCSSALSPALFERAEATYGVPMLEAYGMTEASHQMSSNPLPPGERIVGSVGVATGTEIAIADQTGRLLGSGEAGEVCIRGPGVTPGYLENPEANEASFFDGWFRTGDQGTLDAEGYLRLVGRIKEMILRGGENISPLEIEEALLAHPAIEEAVAFGVPDEKYGETVAAAVSLKSEASEEEILAHSRERLAAFKVPGAVHVLDQIPRTPTGKIQRRRIAEAIYPPDPEA